LLLADSGNAIKFKPKYLVFKGAKLHSIIGKSRAEQQVIFIYVFSERKKIVFSKKKF